MTEPQETLALRLDAQVARELRALAQAEDCPVQALIEEALGRLLEERRARHARPQVMAAYATSHARFGPLYEKLAK